MLNYSRSDPEISNGPRNGGHLGGNDGSLKLEYEFGWSTDDGGPHKEKGKITLTIPVTLPLGTLKKPGKSDKLENAKLVEPENLSTTLSITINSDGKDLAKCKHGSEKDFFLSPSYSGTENAVILDNLDSAATEAGYVLPANQKLSIPAGQAWGVEITLTLEGCKKKPDPKSVTKGTISWADGSGTYAASK